MGASAVVVSIFGDAFGWLTTASEWWGSRGILEALYEHIWYSAVATLVAIIVGLPVGLAIGHSGRGKFAAAAGANGLRAVPTVGIVTLLYVDRPGSIVSVLVALTVLAMPAIVLATAAGIESVEPEVRDAARAIGLAPMQVLVRVEVPNAMPLIFAGVRSAANQVLASATIAGFGFGLGGLGQFIFSGYGSQDDGETYGGTILVVTLVLLVEVGLAALQRAVVSPGVRNTGRRRAVPLDATVTSTLPTSSNSLGELP